MPSVGCVVPVGPGRIANLELCLEALERQTVQPEVLCIVFDGPEAWAEYDYDPPHFHTAHHEMLIPLREKWVPGAGEQPRNIGARELGPLIDAVWFVDSDIVLHPRALECHLEVWRPGRICIGPYEWLEPGFRDPVPECFNDPRWEMFREDRWKDPEYDSYDQVNLGLACFGGNLVWDLDLFRGCGGFWDEIHRGEDGELGLRAVELGIPIRCAIGARGWHLYHEIDFAKVARENAENIPRIDQRHARILGFEHLEANFEKDYEKFA